MNMREVICALGGTVKLPARGSALSIPKNSCWYSPVCLYWGVHIEKKLKSARGSRASRALLKSYYCLWSTRALAFLEMSGGADPDLLWPEQQLTPGLPCLGVPAPWGCSCSPILCSHRLPSTDWQCQHLGPTQAVVDSLHTLNSQRKIIQLCLHLHPDPHSM